MDGLLSIINAFTQRIGSFLDDLIQMSGVEIIPPDVIRNHDIIWFLFAVGGATLGGVFALLKWFAGQLLADIDARLEKVNEVEARLNKLVSELPLLYQRREDSIREFAEIHAKLDRIYEMTLSLHRPRNS